MMGIETVLDSVGEKLPWGMHSGRSEGPAETRDDRVFDEERLLSDEERTLTRHEERLLSDEEYILSAIHTANGRVWQSTLCEELNWSKSKVSRLLTQLEENGKISKRRVGRKNAICLPEREPDIASIEIIERETDPN